MLSTEQEIQASYRGAEVARRYVADRFATELNRLLHDRQVAAINQALPRRGRVLEIAPGPGRLTRAVRPQGPLVCLECNEGMIERGLESSGAKAVWVRGNGFQLPFRTGFDLVYSFRFVRHFHRRDRDRLYTEIRRVLNPGGRFIMDAVNARVSRPLREAHPEDYPIYDKLYNQTTLRAELRDAGLNVIELVPVQRCYRWQYRSQVWLGPRANWLNRLIVRGLEYLPWRDGLEWMVMCRRA